MGSHLLIRGVLIICTIHCNLYLYSKGVYMTKIYSTRDGLPSNTVYAAQQDNLGYIWFGTSRGLSRFDGNEFVNFGINDGAPVPHHGAMRSPPAVTHDHGCARGYRHAYTIRKRHSLQSGRLHFSHTGKPAS